MAIHLWRNLIIFFLACGQQETPKSTEEMLQEASDKVVFSSVEQIGPHRFVSTLSITEYHGEDIRSEHQESLQIIWKDWDNFQRIRKVNGRVASNVIISNFSTWVLGGKGWEKQIDGEVYRNHLRTTWNKWDSLMMNFNEFVTWSPTSLEEMDGRRTQKYEAIFDRPMDTETPFRPYSFRGKVWVDELTAVRILGEIEGEFGRGPYKKKVRLQIQRSDIGGDIEVSLPEIAVPKK